MNFEFRYFSSLIILTESILIYEYMERCDSIDHTKNYQSHNPAKVDKEKI